MLPSLSRGLALALALAASLGYVAWNSSSAYAQDDEDEDEGGDGGDEGDGGDGGDEGGEEEEEEDDKDQPAVTAGGLFTLKTFPIRELDRPLTITQNIAQVRAGLGPDVSAKGAFESWGFNLEGLYGYRDNFMLLGGFTSAYNFKQFGVYAGFEGALAYDLIDFRLAARLSRAASKDTMTGEYVAGDVTGSIDLGFPFRYVARPELAIIALNTLMSIDFDSKPDLNPSLGISTNPIAPVSVVIFAQLQIIDFDTEAGKFKIPATARIQFSPNRKLDLGLEFTFLNMKPEGEAKFYDDRFLILFAASRFGK
jgi:hypothetical protein